MIENRKFVRAPLQLAVSYRTAGSFLVAYTVNLSKGGIFIEAEPLPLGTRVHLVFDVPGAGPIDIEGEVAWVRPANNEGLPVGMGLRFDRLLDEHHGAVIDQIVRDFEGLEILLVGSADRRSQIGRFVHTIVDCDTVEADSVKIATTVLRDQIDLVLADLDTAGRDGIDIVKLARGAPNPTPVIVLGGNAETERWARSLGVTHFLSTPPTFGALQRAVLATLATPSSR